LMSFETGTGNLRQETVGKIVQAFERAGIRFVNRSDMSGVLLRSRR
jgi:hypothetical protein